MRHIVPVLVVILLQIQSFAQSDDLFIVGNTRGRSASVSLRLRADYVAVPVMIANDPKVTERDKQDYIKRRTAKALMESAAKSRSRLQVEAVSWAKQPYIYLLTELDGASRNIGYYTDKIEAMYKPVFFTGKSKCSLGPPTLALRDPESFRPQLTAKIMQSVNALTDSLNATCRVTVEGLGKPVEVKQIDDQNVELFIHYSLSVEIDK